jgi:PAS domain S-box-containing protein
MIAGRPISDICRELAESASRDRLDVLAQILRMAALKAFEQNAWHADNSARDHLVGSWDWDVVHDRVYSDARFAALFGLDPASASLGTPLVSWLAAIHPDDVEDVGRDIESTLVTGRLFSREYRIIANGKTRWVYARGKATLDHNGKPVRFPGAVVDITHEKADEHQLSIAPM